MYGICEGQHFGAGAGQVDWWKLDLLLLSKEELFWEDLAALS